MIGFSGIRIRLLLAGDFWFCWAPTGRHRLIRLA